jgi:isopenicillin-N epimerase
MMTNNQQPTHSALKSHWLLDPTIAFLNHGSFGACPKPVLELQQQLRHHLEQQPLQFFRDYETLLDAARCELATFVGATPENLVFVPNATTGVNAVLRSLAFAPGDELLTTNHEYNACRNALNFVAERNGLRIVVAEVPFPIDHAGQIVDAVMQRVSPKTRLALLDHVTSQTGLVFPIAELVQKLSPLGIETLVDGAHAPGMVPLNLEVLGATYYTGNCHKWLSAPKGAAFLYVQPDRQSSIRPLTISHGANSPRCDRSRFLLEFDWMGTDDPTAYLCVPEALRFMGSLLPGGWAELMRHNHTLAISARQILCDRLDCPLPCPDSMLGALAVIPLPAGPTLPLQESLLERFQIEVPIIPWGPPPGRQVRISAQIYNYLEQYCWLGEALIDLLQQENLAELGNVSECKGIHPNITKP